MAISEHKGKAERPDGETVMIHVRMSPALHRKVRIRAAEENMSIQGYMMSLLERDISPSDAPKGKRIYQVPE